MALLRSCFCAARRAGVLAMRRAALVGGLEVEVRAEATKGISFMWTLIAVFLAQWYE